MPILSLADDPTNEELEGFILALNELCSAQEDLVLDLSQADIDDPVGVVRLAEAIRAASRRFARTRLLRPPQVLAHTLYRVGALEGARLQVEDPREEVGFAG